MVNISLFTTGFIHPRWLFGISSINSIITIHFYQPSFQERAAFQFYDHPGPTTAMDRRAVEAVQNPWPTTPKTPPGGSGASGPSSGHGWELMVGYTLGSTNMAGWNMDHLEDVFPIVNGGFFIAMWPVSLPECNYLLLSLEVIKNAIEEYILSHIQL